MLSSEESAVSWIGKHASPRLKKAVLEKGGLRGILCKIYIIERLALELPDWKISPRGIFSPRENPDEIERSALEETQKQFPEGNVRLCCLTDVGLYASQWSVLVMDCPWSIKDEIIFYIPRKPIRFEH